LVLWEHGPVFVDEMLAYRLALRMLGLLRIRVPQNMLALHTVGMLRFRVPQLMVLLFHSRLLVRRLSLLMFIRGCLPGRLGWLAPPVLLSVERGRGWVAVPLRNSGLFMAEGVFVLLVGDFPLLVLWCVQEGGLLVNMAARDEAVDDEAGACNASAWCSDHGAGGGSAVGACGGIGAGGALACGCGCGAFAEDGCGAGPGAALAPDAGCDLLRGGAGRDPLRGGAGGSSATRRKRTEKLLQGLHVLLEDWGNDEEAEHGAEDGAEELFRQLEQLLWDRPSDPFAALQRLMLAWSGERAPPAAEDWSVQTAKKQGGQGQAPPPRVPRAAGKGSGKTSGKGAGKSKGASGKGHAGAPRESAADSAALFAHWKPRPQDWSPSPVLVQSVADFLQDTRKDAVALVTDANELERFRTVVQSSDCGPDLTLLVPSALLKAEREEFTEAEWQVQRVPGDWQGRVRVVSLAVAHFSDEAPRLKPAASAPQVPTPQQTVVLRVHADWVYAGLAEQAWNGMTKAPGAHFRKWADAAFQGCKDTWSWSLVKGSTVEGLCRVSASRAALAMSMSGSRCAGMRWFVSNVHRDQELPTVPGLTVHWVDWEEGEDWPAYVSRCSRGAQPADFGLARGHRQLGVRKASTPEDLARPKVVRRRWRATGVPRDWSLEDIQGYVTGVGWRMLRLRRGLPGEAPLLDLEDGALELTRLGGDRPVRNDRALPLELKQVFKPARQGPKDRLKSERPRPARAGADAEEPEGSMAVDAGNDRPRLDDGKSLPASTAAVGGPHKRPRAEAAASTLLLPGGLKLCDNAGQGECLFLALADTLQHQGRSKRSAAELRNLVVTHLRRHKATYAGFWRGDAPSAEQEPMLDEGFDAYLLRLSKPGAWAGSIELAAAAATLAQQIFVFRPHPDRAGEFDIRVFGAPGSKTPLALWFRDRHYQALVGESADLESASAGAVKAEIGDPAERGGAPSAGRAASSLGGRTPVSTLGGCTAGPAAPSSVGGQTRCSPPAAPSLIGGKSRCASAPSLKRGRDVVPAGAAEAEESEPAPNKRAICQRRFRENPLVRGGRPRFECDLCDFAFEGSRAAVTSARHHHLVRFHDGVGLPGAIRVDYGVFRQLRKDECTAERYKWKCPLCRFGLPEGVEVSKHAKEVATARHRQQRHPGITNASFQQAACQQAQARQRALARGTKHGFPADQLESLFQEACAALAKAAPRVQAVASIFADERLAVLALQEIDLNAHSLGNVTAGVCSCALEGIADPSRVAAVTTELRCGHSIRKVVLCSLYGHAEDVEAASALARDVLVQLNASGFSWVALGDFNVTVEEAPWAGTLAALPFARVLDNDFLECGPLPATSPSRIRRIDYAVSSRLVVATEVCGFCGCADHLGTAYTLDLESPAGFVPPARLALAEVEVDEARWARIWRARARSFREALKVDCTGAWELLSAAAEEALAGEGVEAVPGVVARHALWSPRRPRDKHRAAAGVESLLLARLRRLHRRLAHLARVPADAPLLRKVRGDLHFAAETFPELRAFADANPLDALESVAGIVKLVADDERRAALRRWLATTSDDFGAQCSWVRRRCALEEAADRPSVPLGDLDPRVVTAPTEVLKQAESEWAPRWTARRDRSDAAVLHALRALPEVPQCAWQVTFDGPSLRGMARSMKGKAPGVDQWRAEELLLLPPPFWQSLAELWQSIADRGDVPRPWQRVRIALLPKRQGGTRPLSLLSVVWRLGAKHMLHQLDAWVGQWLDHTSCGGVPARSGKDLVYQLLAGMREHSQSAVVAQDLAKYFDAIDVRDLMVVLRRLAAPPQLVAVVQALYDGQERLFSRSGFLSGSWVQASRGLCQGCPLSPLLAAAVLRGWSALLGTAGARAASFVDDRYFWASSSDTLCSAKALGDEYDTAFGFHCDSRKCAIAASSASSIAGEVAAVCGYSRVEQLTILGLTLDFGQEGAAVPAAFALCHVRRRLRLVAVLTRSFIARRALMRRLVMPMITWAGAFGVVSAEDARALRRDFLFRVGSATARDKAVPLCLAVVGYECDPCFMRHWSVLHELIRLRSRTRAWQDTAPLSVALRPLGQTLPIVSSILRELGWQLSADERSSTLGSLTDFHRRADVRSCGRLRLDYHRSDQGLATGPSLPVPAEPLCLFAGHHKLYGTGSRALDKLCLGHGCSAWDRQKAQHLEVLPSCVCGLEAPSRPHLLWGCAHFPQCSAAVGAPRDRIQERLLGCAVPEWPAPPPVIDTSEVVEDLAEALRTAWVPERPWLHVATDGSCHAEVASFSVVLDQGTEVAAGVEGEDQSAYKAELSALALLVRAALCLEVVGTLWVVVDCKSLLDAVAGRGSLSALVSQITAGLAVLNARGLLLKLEWVPSHGKPAALCWEVAALQAASLAAGRTSLEGILLVAVTQKESAEPGNYGVGFSQAALCVFFFLLMFGEMAWLRRRYAWEDIVFAGREFEQIARKNNGSEWRDKAEQDVGGRDKLISRILNDLQAKYGPTWMDMKEEDVVVDMTEEPQVVVVYAVSSRFRLILGMLNWRV
ncbi:unnamed protein product, partial [Symbiodinium sp. CCMP2456]